MVKNQRREGWVVRLSRSGVTDGAGVAAFAIRQVVGPILAYHGYQKIDQGVPTFVAFVRRLDVPFPEVTARLVVVMELVGGICLTVGLLTRLWSALLTAEFVTIPFVVKSDIGLVAPRGGGVGFEIDLLVAACLLTLVLVGPGPLSVDRNVRRLRDHPTQRADESP